MIIKFYWGLGNPELIWEYKFYTEFWNAVTQFSLVNKLYF